MSGVFLGLIVVWIIVSNLWDGRKRHKEQLLLKMSPSYSREETLDLVYRTKRQTLIYSLGYGFLLGVAFLSTIRG